MRKPGRYLAFDVQSVSETVGALGQTETWTTILKLRGKLSDFSGYEKAEGMALRSKATHVVHFPRYRSGLTTKHRLLLNNTRIFNILSVENTDGRSHNMRMFVEEIVS